MRDANSKVVKIGEVAAPVLKSMVRFRCGDLQQISQSMLAPLFVAADAHQVCQSFVCWAV